MDSFLWNIVLLIFLFQQAVWNIIVVSVRECETQIWRRWTSSHSALWGESSLQNKFHQDLMLLSFVVVHHSKKPMVGYWSLYDGNTTLIIKWGSLQRKFPPNYLSICFLIAEWKAGSNGKYEARTRGKNKEVRRR